MRVRFSPSSPCGTVKAPVSKSFAHRLLIGAAFAEGQTRLAPFDFSGDIKATAACLERFGAKVERCGEEILVTGTDLGLSRPGVLPCFESGSTLRFLLPLAALCGKDAVFTGTERLLERPLTAGLYDFLREFGFELERTEEGLRLYYDLFSDYRAKSGKTGYAFYLPAGESSQPASGILFCLPFLGKGTKLFVDARQESFAYIRMTAEVLRLFGAGISEERTEDGKRVVFTSQSTGLFAPKEILVPEGDCSGAAFPAALGEIFGSVGVCGVPKEGETVQGDAVYASYFEKIRGGNAVLDVSECIDLYPILCVLCAVSGGGKLYGTRRLRYKESRRDEAMAEELKKCGADITVYESRTVIGKSSLHAPASPLSSHGDHRIAMALSVLLCVFGGELTDAECVSKSYPGFFEDLEGLGVKMSREA